MWGKIKASCLHSLTIAWSYVLALVGAVMQIVDGLGEALGDPSLKDQISAAIGDAKTVGRILLGISILTILARLRSIKRTS
jgi:putative exporter of polyketide antibiotics